MLFNKDGFISLLPVISLHRQNLNQFDANVYDLSILKNLIFDQELMASKKTYSKTSPYFDFHLVKTTNVF